MGFPALFRLLAASLLMTAMPAMAATILVWGDSLSAGYGLRKEESWPALLEKRLLAEKLSHTVHNASISGETTAGGRSRLPAALEAYKPKVVVIELGANDGLRGLPVRSMAANLQAMIDASRGAGAKVLLVGMRMPPNLGPDYTQAFTRAYADLARSNRLRLVPFMMEGFADRRDAFQQDGIHPVAAVQPIILDSIWKELRPLLR